MFLITLSSCVLITARRRRLASVAVGRQKILDIVRLLNGSQTLFLIYKVLKYMECAFISDWLVSHFFLTRVVTQTGFLCFSHETKKGGTEIPEESWQRAFEAEKDSSLHLLPKRKTWNGHNVFIGYGKYLIFHGHCLLIPIAADILFEKRRGSSVVVVISPLRSPMEDHFSFLRVGCTSGHDNRILCTCIPSIAMTSPDSQVWRECWTGER